MTFIETLLAVVTSPAGGVFVTLALIVLVATHVHDRKPCPACRFSSTKTEDPS